jgi:hypothetical protein
VRVVNTYVYVNPLALSQLTHVHNVGRKEGPEGRLRRIVAEGRLLHELEWSSVYTAKSSIFLYIKNRAIINKKLLKACDELYVSNTRQGMRPMLVTVKSPKNAKIRRSIPQLYI